MTNNKIKMANKNGVPDPIMDLMTAAKNEDIEGVISSMMALDDETFDKMAPRLKENFEKIFTSNAYHNNIMQKLNLMTEIDYQKEKEGYDGINKFLDELEISSNKKEFLKYIFGNSYNAMLKYKEDPSEHINVIIKKLHEDAIIPTYAHIGDAGADIYAYVNDHITVPAGGTVLVPTGIALKIPGGYEAQVRPRSGMSLKTKIRVANAPGTIDSNYRGEINVIIDNRGSAPYIIKNGDKIAQLVFNKVPTADFAEGEVEIESNNTRGENGFGSSGANITEQKDE